jgi:hypothetical protein
VSIQSWESIISGTVIHERADMLGAEAAKVLYPQIVIRESHKPVIGGRTRDTWLMCENTY